MRFIALFIIFLQLYMPAGVGLLYAQESIDSGILNEPLVEDEEGLFGFSTKESLRYYGVFLEARLVLCEGTADGIRQYLGGLPLQERSEKIIAVPECAEHVRGTLTVADFAELLQGVTEQAVQVILPDSAVVAYVTALTKEEKNIFFSTISVALVDRIIALLPADVLHDVLLDLSDENQMRALETMSNEEAENFVKEENKNGLGGVLLVGLGAAAALYLLSVISAGTAAAATAGVMTVATVPLVPFGGRSLAVAPCTCTPGFFLVAVGPPRPGLFMYGPGTFLFAHYNILPPAWQFGRASVPLPCFFLTPAGCVPIGVGLYVVQVGTSVL